MDIQEKILSTIRMKGPIMPLEIAHVIGTDSMIASAHLADLVSRKILKMTSVKKGTSNIYYLPGQESKIESYMEYLQEKVKRAAVLLKEKRVLREKDLDPLNRVAIREAKDYAIPLIVSYNNLSETFWKWYLISDEEAKKQISIIIAPPIQKTVQTVLPEEKIAAPKPKEILPESKIETKPKKVAEVKQTQTPLVPKQELVQKAEKIEKPQEEGSFLALISTYFQKNNIAIIEKTIVKKDSEVEFIITVPSPIGTLKYYCRAKGKKRINEGDLSAAYIYSQSKKLPVLFITSGELTKKAQELMEKEFPSMTVQRV